MKLNWIVIICGALLVAATFSIAYLEGANAAAENAITMRHAEAR